MTTKHSNLILGAALAASLFVPQLSFASSMSEEESNFLNKINQMLGQQPTSAFAVKKSIFPSLFEVDLTNGTTIIVDESGQVGIVGGRGGAEVFNFAEGESLTKERRAKDALNYVKGNDSFITYKAKSEKTEIYVFADIQCGYCQQLHESIPELNSYGITVNYMPFAMYENSDLFMNAAFCSKNPEEKYTEINDIIANVRFQAEDYVNAINGSKKDYNNFVGNVMNKLISQSKSIVNSSDCDMFDMDDVSFHARGFGIMGTPNILFSSGKLTQGALEVKEILSLAF